MSDWNVRYDGERDFGTIAHPVIAVEQSIQFQHGPIGDHDINGVQNEEVLQLITQRLRYLNSKFPCRENSIAITKIEEAIMWLRQRTAIRQAQGVEGQNIAHVS